MPNDWFWSEDHLELCRLIETRTLWGHTVCRVWLPEKNIVVQVPAERLRPLSKTEQLGKDHIIYIATAAKIADSLNQDILLAPIDSSVIPLPHQIKALSKAVSGPRVRYLLADEVGLGKTIEAGLIMRELKLRGLIRRTLVVAPKGLVTQWVAEMKFHFGEDFKLILPEDLKTLYRLYGGNPWRLFDQVVVPMDSIKPIEKRRGWSKEQIDKYNRERFEDLITAGWDLIIVDEAHRLAGSTDQVARYKLGRGLSEAAPYLLLLSATPHQGKTDAFRRLMSLLDKDAFPDEESITRERVSPYVIRTEKRQAIDAEGKPLFKPRRTELATISWGERHSEQQLLYEAVTEYVRQGYNRALEEKRHYIGFLMILMQRLVASSTRAIRTTLERRLKSLRSPAEFPLLASINEEEWADLDPQEQLEILLQLRLKAFAEEEQEVKRLLEMATACEAHGPDVKAQALLDWIYRLQAEENDPNLKVLVFTEFVPTQEMLYGFLTERGFKAVCLNGSMSLDERRRVQEAFAKEAQILISTDAGGEGLNLQFCHVVINYDIPWNPMRLEQRIGRVDRIGQTHPVRAINFVLEDSVEHRVLEVLEEKLAVIFEELGIDKTGDVLDSAQAERIFDELYLEAILNPQRIETKIDEVLLSLREQAREAKEAASILSAGGEVETEKVKELLSHPFPYWVERMTVSFLKAHGGRAERKKETWSLIWPDGEKLKTSQLTLEEPRIRGLIQRLPQFVPGQPVPVVTFPELSQDLRGFWSLWRITLHTEEWNRYRIMPLFIDDEHKVFIPAARYIWDRLLSDDIKILGYFDGEDLESKFEIFWKSAEKYGESFYEELIKAYHAYLDREKEKMEHTFRAKLKAIKRVGLREVREYRLKKLEEEKRKSLKEYEQKKQIVPEMTPLIVVRIEPRPS